MQKEKIYKKKYNIDSHNLRLRGCCVISDYIRKITVPFSNTC